MATRNERVARLQSKRLVYAAQVQQAVIDEYTKRFEPYIYGQPFFPSEESRRDYQQQMGENSDALRIKRGYDTTTFPLHHMMRSVMMPYLVARDPNFINRQRDHASPLEWAMVDLYCNVASTVWEESETTREVQRALDDAFGLRLGWTNTLYDPHIGLPVHKWIDARNMLVDCETQSPRIRDRRWVAEKIVLPIDTAKWFAKEVWDAPNYEFEPVKFDSVHDSDKGVKSRQRNGASIREDGDEDAPTKFVRLVMVQVKGENPWTMSANIADRKANDPAGKDTVYDGKDHVLIMEACGGYMNADAYKVVGRIDWPFPCKRGQFTYTPFMLTRDNRSVYPVSIMQAAHSAQVAADVALQAYNTDSRLSARRWFGYAPEAFQNKEDADTILDEDVALLGVPLKPGNVPSNTIGTGNFGSPNQHLQVTFAQNRENYEAIQGMNKFDVQVRANQTAANTMVQNESAQVKVEDLAQLVESAVVELGEKGVMCARANMTYDQLIEWVHAPQTVEGPDGKPQKVVEEVPKRGGGIVVTSALWDDDPDWEDVRRDVEINLEQRSVRFVNPEKEAASVKELQDYQMQIARIIGDTIAKGGVTAAQEIARTANETIKMIGALKNIANYERLLFRWEKFTAPEPPPVSGDAMLNAQMQNAEQQGELNAQQMAAFTRLQQQGANPAAFPQAVQAQQGAA